MHRHERLIRFAEEVGAQTLGTVTGAGLLYVSAAWLGMLEPPPARVVVAVLAMAVLPATVVLVPHRRRAAHARDDELGTDLAGGLDVEVAGRVPVWVRGRVDRGGARPGRTMAG